MYETLESVYNNVSKNENSIAAPCYQLHLIGLYCVVLFVCSAVVNSLLIWTVWKNKQLHTPINYLITSLAFVNLLGTVIQLPLLTLNAFSCRFLYSRYACDFIAFDMYFTGCMGIYILVTISIERYLVICKPFCNFSFNTKRSLISIVICACVSLIWCCSPIFGWSYYTFEGAKISCAIEWNMATANVLSYNITILFFVYFLPLFSLIFTNAAIVQTVKRSTKRLQMNIVSRTKLNKEHHLVKLTIVLITAFFFSWTPYAIASLYVALSNGAQVAPMFATVPAFVAKSSMLWPSLVHIFFNRNIKMFLLRNNSRKSSRSSAILKNPTPGVAQ